MITFRDETEKLRFSIKSDDILFVESTDNYVTVHTLEKGKIKKIMLRNTMKTAGEGAGGNPDSALSPLLHGQFREYQTGEADQHQPLHLHGFPGRDPNPGLHVPMPSMCMNF